MKLVPDLVMLLVTAVLFADFLVSKTDHTGMIWIYFFYVAGCIWRISLLHNNLDKYVIFYPYREKLGLTENILPKSSIFTWVVISLMVAAGLYAIIDFLFL